MIPWFLFLAALAFSPDAKLHRLKLTHMEWALLAAAVSWAWAGLKSGWVWRRTALDLPVTVFALLTTVFHLLSPEKTVSGPELRRVLLGCGAFFIASQTLAQQDYKRHWGTAWSLLAAALGAWYAAPRLLGEEGRAMASFGNPIFFASFLLPAVLFCDPVARPERASSVGALTLLILQLAGLLSTGTRASILALAATATLLLLLHGRQWRLKLAGAAAIAAAAAAAVSYSGRPATHGLIWEGALRMWLDHPFTGAGLGRFHLEFPAYASQALRALWPQGRMVVNHAHSEPLQTLAETGLLGLGALAWLWAAFALSAPADEEDRPRAPFYWAAAALWLQSLLSPDMRFGVTWTCAFVLAAVGLPAAAEAHWHPGRTARHGVIALVTAAAGWAAWAAHAGSHAALALEEPPFFTRTAEQDAELARRRQEAAARPDDPLVWEQLAYLHAKRQEFPAAIAAFERAAALDAKRAGPLNNLGNIHYLQGRPADAMKAWEEALRRDPALADVHINLGIVYYSQGRLKEAAAHLEKALAIDPGNQKARALLRRMTE